MKLLVFELPILSSHAELRGAYLKNQILIAAHFRRAAAAKFCPYQ